MLFGKHGSPGSEQRYAMMMILEEKKRKRMISNRESAKRSRLKRQKHMEDLTKQINGFLCSKNELLLKINTLRQLHGEVEAENRVLRAQLIQLGKKLESLQFLLSYINNNNNNNNNGVGVGGVNDEYSSSSGMDITETLFKAAWRDAAHKSMPLIASTATILQRI